MLLFTRLVTLSGDIRRQMSWVGDITTYVRDHSDLDVSAWAGTFGHPLGTVGWTAVVESQAALAASTSPLLADDGYLDLLERGAEFVQQPGADLLAELVHGPVVDSPHPLGAVATVTRATAYPDRFADALGWGVEIAQHVEEVIGMPVFVLSSVYGQMGELVWIAVSADAAGADAARAKLNADPGYVERMKTTRDLFIAGSATVALNTRIA